jgi:AhpD family alkylhydroperoxidase
MSFITWYQIARYQVETTVYAVGTVMSDRFETYEETVTDIEESLGIVPGFLEALPEQDLINEWPNQKRFFFGETEIDPKTRELIGLAVAAAIGCEYCRHFHKGAAQLHGATEAELSELSFLASYTTRYSAIIQAQDYDLDTFYQETEEIGEHLQAQMAAGDD